MRDQKYIRMWGRFSEECGRGMGGNLKWCLNESDQIFSQKKKDFKMGLVDKFWLQNIEKNWKILSWSEKKHH